MYSRTYSLSFVLDRDGWLKKDLITSNSLYKLDEYIKKNYKSHKDVRKKYDETISEFCLEHMDLIQEENKRNHHNATGRIVILENNYNQDRLFCMRQLMVIYQNNDLLSRKKCLHKIKKILEEDDNKIEDLYKRKSYLLSKNEMDLLRIYLSYKNFKYKKNAIGFLINRIKEMDSNRAYYYCRHLAHLCGLVEKKEIVRNISINEEKIPSESSLIEVSPYYSIEIEQITMDKILKKEGKKNV